jgi:hypothetical protein
MPLPHVSGTVEVVVVEIEGCSNGSEDVVVLDVVAVGRPQDGGTAPGVATHKLASHGPAAAAPADTSCRPVLACRPAHGAFVQQRHTAFARTREASASLEWEQADRRGHHPRACALERHSAAIATGQMAT